MHRLPARTRSSTAAAGRWAGRGPGRPRPASSGARWPASGRFPPPRPGPNPTSAFRRAGSGASARGACRPSGRPPRPGQRPGPCLHPSAKTVKWGFDGFRVRVDAMVSTPVDRRSARAWMRIAFAMFAVGWGANQFSPMLIVYRHELRLAAGEVAALSAGFAGLMTALSFAAGVAVQPFARRLPDMLAGAVAGLVCAAPGAAVGIPA